MGPYLYLVLSVHIDLSFASSHTSDIFDVLALLALRIQLGKFKNRSKMSTWVIVGASRGIGLEFVKQLLARGDRVIATVRDVAKASALWSLAGSGDRGACQLLECDVASETSIKVRLPLPRLSSHDGSDR